MSLMGNLEDRLTSTFCGPADSTLDCSSNEDITGVGVIAGFHITASLVSILVVSIFVEGYVRRPTLASRFNDRRRLFHHVEQTVLDQLVVTSVALAIAYFAQWPALSAYSRKITQLCLSLSNIMSLTLFVSRPVGIRQALIAIVISLAWFIVAIRNALDMDSVLGELQWLKTGTDQAMDSSPFPGVIDVILSELGCLFAIFLRCWRHRDVGATGVLAGLLVGLPLILHNVKEIRDSRKQYVPQFGDDSGLTFGQVIPLVASIAPLLACFEMLVQVHSNAPQQPPKTVVGEDTPESDAGVPWYITICPAIFPVMPLLRRVKVLAILLGVAGASVCLVLLFQWYSSNRATVRQISPLVRRITDYRLNLLRFAFWNASSDVGYGTTSPEPFSSQSWFRRTHKVPPGYRRISWECSCGELLAADFENSNPDATTALQQRLHGLSNTGIANSPQQNSGNLGSATGSTSQGNSQSSTPQPQTPTGSRKRPSANTSGTSTPSTSHQGASNSNISQRARKPRYLELCVSVGQHSVNLGEINISSVTTDGQLFKKIWESYREIKKSSSESTLRNWFFKPDDVFFVHFGVTNRHQVGIYGKPMEIPPPEEVQQGRYHYFQCPMQPLPPMPNHIFLHYLDRAKSTSSSNTHAEDIYLSRLPKKTGSSIFTARTGVNTTVLYGWGVHIIERPSAFAQSMVGIASALICIVFFGFTWGFADLSTAIGIGQFVGAVLALANAAIYFALQAYSTRLSRKAE